MDTKNLAVIGFGGRGHIYGEFFPQISRKIPIESGCRNGRIQAPRREGKFPAREVYEDYKELLVRATASTWWR